MSRRAIRDMLMGPKKRTADRAWVLPAAMAAVLVLGVGLGAGVGLLVDRHGAAHGPGAAAAPHLATAPAAPRPAPDPLVSPPRAAPAPPAVPPRGPVSRSPLLAPSRVPSLVPSLRPVALTAPPRPKAPSPPAWVRYAVPAPSAHGRPMIAVVIDDLGLDLGRTRKVIGLPGPLTLAFMTYAHDLARQTAEARARGDELMVHMPMQPVDGNFNPGPKALLVGLSAAELRRRIEWGLSRFGGFVGVNNHMGSRFTADPAGMAVVMREMARHGLMFLDSVTTGHSVAAREARAAGVPFAARQVFLDNTQTVASVLAQLADVERIARRHGSAIAIGHPHDATIQALTRWLPTLRAHGFVLVPVTAIVEADRRRAERQAR